MATRFVMTPSIGFCYFRRCRGIKEQLRVNEAIRAREVRLVSETGEQLGVFSSRDALRIAQEHGFDLVEVAPTARPPVCRIMDYGKYKYEQSKRDREARKKQKVVTIKEVKMRPNIEEHDFEVRRKQTEAFLREGDKIKATIMFRGREVVHADLGRQLLDRLLDTVKDLCVVERPAKLEGKNMILILAPKNAPAEPAKPAPVEPPKPVQQVSE
ncbi:MAG: translation initiation factor IF-3 [Mycobacterium leprae]